MARDDEALHEPLQRYRILFEQAPVGVFIYDSGLVIKECNPRFVEILRSTQDQLIGLDMRTLADQSVLPALLCTLRGETARYNGAYSATTSGARIFIDMRLAPLRDAGGALEGGMGVVEDVTEAARAEAAVRASEARFRLLIERAPDAIAVISHDRHILYANAALAQLLGYASPDDLIGMKDTEPIHPDDRPILEERKPRIIKNEILPAQEYRMVRKDGGAVHVEILSMPIEYEGKPAALSFARDLTERRLMQARLMLAVRMVSVGTLAAGVAHEINNPLAYTMANLDMIAQRRLPEITTMLERDELVEAQAKLAQVGEMVGIAREGAERVRSIVRDLKTFSRGDDERRGPVDVRRVLDASINMAWNEIRHRARLVKEYEGVPIVEANESKMGQVFLNLLVNAAQALPVGGAAENTIRVRAKATEQDDDVTVEIADTGPGIPPDILARIFDPFFTTKPIGLGTGLGLWISEGIVHSFGGAITVESAPGKGATFRVTLPRSARLQTAPREGSIPPSSAAPAERRGRVLVVDDEAALARTISSALMEEHDVVSTSSGREALELLRNDDRFDAVLCDLMMPDVTGMDLYEKILRDKPALASRFVFVTGGAFTPRAREFLDGVRAPRIDKPFDVSRLLDVIRKKVAASKSA